MLTIIIIAFLTLAHKGFCHKKPQKLILFRFPTPPTVANGGKIVRYASEFYRLYYQDKEKARQMAGFLWKIPSAVSLLASGKGSP